MQGTLPYVFFAGNVCREEEARISIACHSLQYGITCFGGIRGYRHGNTYRIFRLKDHHERLMNSARLLGMNYYMPYDRFAEVIEELIQKNQPKGDLYIRPFIFSPTSRLAPRMPGLDFDLAIYFVEMGTYFDPSKGVKLGISSWRKFSDSMLPTKAKAGGCYVNSSLATTDALRNGYDDALMLDANGYVVEGSVSNLIMVYRDKIFLPDIGSALLEGITMRTVVELLEEENYTIRYGNIDRSMVYSCQELMLVGTAVQINYVESVDGRHIGPIQKVGAGELPGPGPVCQLLRKHFSAIIDGKHAKSKDWLHEFPI